jgi:hypothetical protein
LAAERSIIRVSGLDQDIGQTSHALAPFSLLACSSILRALELAVGM